MRNQRAGRWAAGVIALAAAAGAGWWAGQATLAPRAEAGPATEHRVEATVTEGSVGRTVAYNVTVAQPFTTVASNTLTGTVTHVGAAEVGVGDEVYSVDGVPVRAVTGSTPFWRDVGADTRGPDVAQLEQALADLGHFDGTVDERFTAATARGVRAWQKASGRPQTGMVAHGEIIAVPSLPTTLRLDDAVRVGLVLTGGEPAVRARQAAPTFMLVLTAAQAAQIPPEAPVTVTFQDTAWPAIITATEHTEGEVAHLALTAPDGGPVCGQDCGILPPEEEFSLRADLTVVPSATGPAVPAAAVHTDAAGDTSVLRPDGTRTPVTVLASGDGIAIVDGLEVGDTVLVLDDTATAGQGDDDE